MGGFISHLYVFNTVKVFTATPAKVKLSGPDILCMKPFLGH